ncbi:MAG TPA: hypothetical protein VK817_15195 [Trebonia sp.]|jgi:hypothetical protein|nr:hypothetical protein [Trebonia sp.]
MTMGAADQLEIRPVKPQGRLLPADNAVLDKWVLRANTANGTLEFTEDRAFIITSPRTVVFSLPSSGQADAVHTLCLVNYGWRKNIMSGTTWRPLFLDSGGRVVGKGRTRDQPRASELWPTRIFEPLRELGINVTERSFGTEKEYKHAYPGA